MKAKTLRFRLVSAVALSAILAPSLSSAETRSDTYAGATCIPYPPFDSDNAVPYSNWLYGFNQSAYCHFTRLGNWTVDHLSYVLFQGYVGSGTSPMRVRLCVYSASTHTCGAERTIEPGGAGVNWVAPPSTPPSYASGAYLRVGFPSGVVSLFREFTPVWTK
jgi:hypothetical protein